MAEETRTADAGDAPDETAGRFGRAKDYVNDAKEYVNEQYTRASGAVKDGYNTVREKVEDVDFGAITDQVRSYVRSNPGKALLISVGIGFVVGLMLRRDENED
ncbi:MAG TPA: hypothetical protein VF381_15360 [Thermoanaerobaculia bacterium]